MQLFFIFLQDEVIAVSEKVIVKLEDLVKWAHLDFSKWKCGLRALPLKLKELGKNGQKECTLKYRQSILNSGLNFKDVFKEKAELGKYLLAIAISFYSDVTVIPNKMLLGDDIG